MASDRPEIGSGSAHQFGRVKGVDMEKWMCLGSMIAAGLLLLIFVLDLVLGIPFSASTPEGQKSPYQLVDMAGIVACGILGYLGWNAYQDVK